jgi:hypothetical protein
MSTAYLHLFHFVKWGEFRAVQPGISIRGCCFVLIAIAVNMSVKVTATCIIFMQIVHVI